jgi:hypothetical protein
MLQAQAAALRKVPAGELPQAPLAGGSEGGLAQMLARGLSDRFAKLAAMRRDHTVDAAPAAVDSTFG